MRLAHALWNEVGWRALLPRQHVIAEVLGETTPLGEIAEIASGLYVRRYISPDTPGAVPYLRVDNVREFVPNMTDGDVVYVNADLVPSYERVSVKAGDVVIPRTATLGRAFVVPELFEGAVMSQHATRLRLRSRDHVVSPLVLAAYLNTQVGQEAVLARASGSTRLELTHANLAEVPVPKKLSRVKLEQDAEQRSETLLRQSMESVASARLLCERLCGEAIPKPNSGFRTFMADLAKCGFVKSGLPRFHEPEVTEAIDRLGRSFELRPLGKLAEVRRGAGTTSREYRSKGIPYLRTSSLVNNGIDLFPAHFGDESTYRKHGQNVGTGDILLTIEGKIGLVALLGKDERVLIKNHIEVVRPMATCPLPPEFIAAWLGSSVAAAQIRRATIIQATIPGIASASRDLVIPVRSVDGKSDTFDRVVEEIEFEMTKSTQARAALKSLYSRLLENVRAACANAGRAHLTTESALMKSTRVCTVQTEE